MSRPLPRLIVITDPSLPWHRLVDRLEAVLSLGPEVALQLRHPGASGRTLLEEARALRELCARFGNPLFVNERLDIARLVDAHLHLPAHAFDPEDARPHLGGRWISVAVHDEHEARRARGADLALVSPVFGAGSKPGDTRAPLGAEGFERLARQLPCPALALGGVTAETVTALPGAAIGVAAVSAVLHAADPMAAAGALLRHTRSAA